MPLLSLYPWYWEVITMLVLVLVVVVGVKRATLIIK